MPVCRVTVPANYAATLLMRDDQMTVRATLVDHPPVVPAFAYRFDAVRPWLRAPSYPIDSENARSPTSAGAVSLEWSIASIWVASRLETNRANGPRCR